VEEPGIRPGEAGGRGEVILRVGRVGRASLKFPGGWSATPALALASRISPALSPSVYQNS